MTFTVGLFYEYSESKLCHSVTCSMHVITPRCARRRLSPPLPPPSRLEPSTCVQRKYVNTYMQLLHAYGETQHICLYVRTYLPNTCVHTHINSYASTSTCVHVRTSIHTYARARWEQCTAYSHAQVETKIIPPRS